MTPRQYLTAPDTSMSLRAFLEATFADNKPKPFPELYATTKRAFSGRAVGGMPCTINAGQRVRVTDIGRFNDAGITSILEEIKRDEARATLDDLILFSSRP